MRVDRVREQIYLDPRQAGNCIERLLAHGSREQVCMDDIRWKRRFENFQKAFETMAKTFSVFSKEEALPE
jgi:hypothetical protein